MSFVKKRKKEHDGEAEELMTIQLLTYPECQRFFKRRAVKRQEENRREKGEKTSGCQRQLGQDLILPPDWRNLIL